MVNNSTSINKSSIKSHEKYIDMFNDFLKNASMASTYMPVLLRAFVDIEHYGEDNLIGKQWIRKHENKIELELDFLAIRFAKYYWDMEVAFKMRHMPKRMASIKNPDDDINIIGLVTNEAISMVIRNISNYCNTEKSPTLNNVHSKIMNMLTDTKPPTLETLASDQMQEFRQNVIQKSIKYEPLKHITNYMKELYQRVPNKNYIIFEPDLIDFMKNHSFIIKKALNYVIALHFEKNNPSARHIALKIDTEKDFEHRLTQIKKLEYQIKKPIIEKNEKDIASEQINHVDSA